MRVFLRNWLGVVRTLGRLMVVTAELFWRYPVEMVKATTAHVLGDRKRARELLREIDQRDLRRRRKAAA